MGMSGLQECVINFLSSPAPLMQAHAAPWPGRQRAQPRTGLLAYARVFEGCSEEGDMVDP